MLDIITISGKEYVSKKDYDELLEKFKAKLAILEVLEQIIYRNNTSNKTDNDVTLMNTRDLYSAIFKHECKITELNDMIAKQSNTIIAMKAFIKEKFIDAPF